MRPILYATPVWLCAFCAYAQDVDNNERDIDLQQITDELLAYPDEEMDYEDLYENLVQYLSSPLDLNNVTAEELRSLNILNDLQIENFLVYRKEQQVLLAVYELQIIPSFDTDVVAKLSPFVCVINPASGVNRSLVSRVFSAGHSHVVTRYERTLESKRGFQSSGGNAPAYHGSPDKTYFRFRSAIPGDFSIGVTGEKDAGEAFSFSPKDRQWGFDFTSWHLQLKNKGRIKNLIAGDFQAQFGQGLVLGGAFGLGKGGESIATVRKSNIGIQPYTSVNESTYQRGLALTLHPFKFLEVSAFYSRAFRDASAGNGTDSATVTGFQTSGYHRTAPELAGRKRVAEQHAALVINFRKENFDGGLIVDHIQFDTPVKHTPTRYNQHAFRGSRNLNTSAFLNYRIDNIAFFGELARSLSGGWASIAGALINAHNNLEFAILWRSYGKHYHTFYSNAFSENTLPANERAIYWGWKYRWNRRYSMTGYVDLFEFPWLGFRRYSPSEGYEWLLRGNYKPSRNASFFVQFREESKALNSGTSHNMYKVENGIRHNVSLQSDYGIGERIRFRSRVQFNAYRKDNTSSEGWALVQDIGFSAGSFRITGRHALFDTDHYDNRHYMFENDAWSSYSLPAYSGVGVRNYVLFECKINKIVTIWLRYARTRVLNSGEIGSGQDLIEGNTRNDVKFQARLKF